MRMAFGLLSVFAVSVALGFAAEADDYIKDGKLKETLKLRDGQSGFAGVSGTSWTVEPTGKWTEFSFLNEKETKKRDGTLDKKQLEALAKVLADNKLTGLPKTFGKQEGANPKTYSLSFGKMTSQLTLDAGEDIAKAKGVKDEEALKRYAAIVLHVKDLLKEEKK